MFSAKPNLTNPGSVIEQNRNASMFSAKPNLTDPGMSPEVRVSCRQNGLCRGNISILTAIGRQMESCRFVGLAWCARAPGPVSPRDVPKGWSNLA